MLFGSKKSIDDPINKIRPKLIQYTFPDNRTLVHKESGYPILQESQLIVGPSQTVLFVRNGQIFHQFESGAQVLDTGLLRSTLRLYGETYEGGENGVPVDLYFINNLFSDPMPWGLPSPIQINDPKLELLIDVTANGQLRYQITDPQLYIQTNMNTDTESLNRLCKQKVLGYFADAVRGLVQSEQIGYFELAGRTVQLSERLRNILNAKIEPVEGFSIVEFTVAAFIANKEDLAALKEAQTYKKRGTTYKETELLKAMNTAAGNQGMGGTMMGAGMGWNMGSEMAGMMSEMMRADRQNQQSQQYAQPPMQPAAPAMAQPAAVRCAQCSAPLPEGAKFCMSCGAPAPAAPAPQPAQAHKFCMNCGNKLDAAANFCPNCGQKQ